MARLPTPGQDDNAWGTILNDFLDQAHNNDGSLKTGSVGASTLQDNSVTSSKLQDSSVSVTKLAASSGSDGQVLTQNSSQSGGLSWTTITGSTGPATASSLGTIQLAGDLGGPATAPTVPGLTGKADKTTTVSAGTGLTGGGDLSSNRTLSANFGATAGTIAQGNDSRITGAVQASTATTKGDVLAATGSGVISRVGVGSDGEVLTADSTQTTGVDWKSPTQTQTIDWVNVKLAPYNATGNGSTDDTTAVQSAITAAMAGTSKRVVFFPAGTYKMTQGITLQSGLTLLGEALSEKEFQNRSTITNTTTDTFVWGGGGATDNTQQPKDLIIRGLCFSGSMSTTNFITPVALDASGAYPSHMVIEECGIHNYISIYSGAAQALTLRDSYLNNTSATSLNIGGSDNYIMRNFIDGYIAGSQSGSTMVYLQCQESVFTENYVTCSPAMGVKVGGWSVGLRITNNQINGLAQAPSHGGGNYADGPGIYVAAGARGVVIDGNAIANICANPWGIMDSAITIVDSSDIVVSNNIIDTLQNVAGKHLRITQSSNPVTRIKVRGNVYTNGQSTDVTPKVTITGTTSNINLDEWGAVSQTAVGPPSDSSFVVTPPDGTLATDTSSNTLYVRSAGSWSAISGTGATQTSYMVTTSDQPVLNSTTYVDVTGLSWSVVAGEVWMVTGQLVYDASTTGDIKFQFVTPASTTWYGTLDGLTNGAAGSGSSVVRQALGNATVAGFQLGGIGVGVNLDKVTALVTGWFSVTTSGTIKIQFAQGAIDATNPSTVYTNSFLYATRLV